MTEPRIQSLSFSIQSVAGDCRADREDAALIGHFADSASPADRREVADLMRRCAANMDPEGFAALRELLSGGDPAFANRVLLAEGARGPEVERLRETMGRLARDVFCDRRADPGPGRRFDATTRISLSHLQALLKVPADGRLDGRTLLAINVRLVGRHLAPLDIERPAARLAGIRLHFYPGDHAQSLVVMQGKKVLDVYPMRGGPEQKRPDSRSNNVTGMPYSPTPPGHYRLAGSGAHTTSAWKLSQIPWGAALREKDGEIQFQQAPGGSWKFATGEKSVFRRLRKELQFERREFLDARGQVRARWEYNDFGHRAVFLSRDEKRQGHMIHATPREEARYGGEQLPLTESHGCEHMYPEDLDEALAKGYFRPGTPFIVHGYGEELPPAAQARRDRITRDN